MDGGKMLKKILDALRLSLDLVEWAIATHGMYESAFLLNMFIL